MSSARTLAPAAAGGLVGSLATPPFDVLPAIVAGLAILAWTVARAPTLRSAAARGLTWGAVGQLVGLHFVVPVVDRFTDLGPVFGVAALVLLAAAQGLAWGAGAGVAHLLARRAGVPSPLAFGAGVLAACSLRMFAWTPAGLLSPRPELVQLAEFVGERGVSAVVGVVAALCAGGLWAVASRRGGAAAAQLLGALLLVVAVDRAGAARIADVAEQERPRSYGWRWWMRRCRRADAP